MCPKPSQSHHNTYIAFDLRSDLTSVHLASEAF